MEKVDGVMNTSKEGAIDNKAFELDDQCVDVEAGRVIGAQFLDDPQNGVYVVPLSQNLPEDTSANRTLQGDKLMAVKDDETENQPSKDSTNNGKAESARTVSSMIDIQVDYSVVQNPLASVNETNMKSRKGTVLHFSNKGFEDDALSIQQQQIGMESQGMLVKNEKQLRRKRIVAKLRNVCLHVHLRCIGIALVCLIILALFVVPPSTSW